MRFGHIEIFVNDPQRAKAFYQDVLGLELVSDQGQFIWFKLSNTEILLRPGKNPQQAQTYQQAASALVIFTDDLEAEAAALRERGLTFKGDDGEGCLTFTDLDGNWFQLANPHT